MMQGSCIDRDSDNMVDDRDYSIRKADKVIPTDASQRTSVMYINVKCVVTCVLLKKHNILS